MHMLLPQRAVIGKKPKKRTGSQNIRIDGTRANEFYQTLTADTCVLIEEATIATFSFARLIKDLVKEVIIANTCELKQTSLAWHNTDKIDADKLCRILKAQVLSGEQLISPAVLPPVRC